MSFNRLIFRVHAIQRMYQRSIKLEDVQSILKTGEVIEEYPNDTPYPSRLVLGWCGNRPLHTVVADNTEHGETIIITVYEPDPDEWDPSFKRRKMI